MASSSTNKAKDFADYWKDDFLPLKAAGDAVNAALRSDEQEADLNQKIVNGGENSHLYFKEQKQPPPLLSLKHRKTVPLPHMLEEELGRVKYHSAMGLFTKANMVWLSVDEKLFLWSFKASRNSICCYSVPSGDCVVAVGLVNPRKNVFIPNIKHCVVVTTADEVRLLALVHSDSHSAAPAIVPTVVSSPNNYVPVRMITVAGSDSGRIFLGGDDGCVYEMTYGSPDDSMQMKPLKNRLDEFYDDGMELPESIDDDDYHDGVSKTIVSLGKRTWENISGSAWTETRPNKSARLNHTAQSGSLLRSILPDFLTRPFTSRAAPGGGRIIQIKIDEYRQCLYTLSSTGFICAFDLSSKNDVRLTGYIDTMRTTRQFLEAVSHNRGMPSSSSSYMFPGGSSSAQAGVGGMEGARAILKLADYNSRHKGGADGNRQTNTQILMPISIHVIEPTESSRLTLLVVTAGGLRLHMSSLARDVIQSGLNAVRYSGSSRYSSSRKNPLSPSSRLWLCHIRSPSSLKNDHATVSQNVEGGIIPRVSSTMRQVDATWYRDGVLVSAIREENKTSVSAGRNGKPFGDVIVATSPDLIARKVETTTPTSVETDKQDKFMFLSGIVESISLPLSTAYGGEDPSTVLPGGAVCDIGEVASDEESPFVNLIMHSTTPTDSELSIGLPPAYFPPSKIRQSDQSKRSQEGSSPAFRGPNNASRAIVPTSNVSNSLQVVGTIITNLILSKPINTGISSDRRYVEEESSTSDGEQSYRISKRDAWAGFSRTAKEISTRIAPTSSSATTNKKNTRSPKSARLRSWLMRPHAVPLNHLSKQFYSPNHDVIILNVGGLHFFRNETVVSELTDALFAASGSVGNDEKITSFFRGYGYKEGCCMCLALAIGWGRKKDSRPFLMDLRNKATIAVMGRAFITPRLIQTPEQNTGQPFTGQNNVSDPLIPEGYNFEPSVISEGLTSLFARLVRPIWHKPAVVVTEGRTVRFRRSDRIVQTPAKVELLLDEKTLNDIGSLLRDLLVLTRSLFERVVRNVPGAPNPNGDAMDYEGVSDENSLVHALRYNNQSRGASNGVVAQLLPHEAHRIAELLDEKNIHSLYRLLARAVQLVSLMTLLRRSASLGELREVDWGLLHGLTFSQLVQTAEGQDRLEALLNSLVTASAANGARNEISSAKANELSDQFAVKCYLFFSPGSRFAFLGLRDAHEALSQPINSQGRATKAAEAANCFLRAAFYWHSAPLITGGILHTNTEETYDEIAKRALQYNSPLAKAVESLVMLHDVENAVEVCLTTAANFQQRGLPVRTEPDGGQRAIEFTWEQNLYHKRRNNFVDNEGNSIVTGSAASSHVIAYGTEVTARDAIKTCYALIFYYVSELLNSDTMLGSRMISACASSNDTRFLETFFKYLLDNSRTDYLVRIESQNVEQFLRDQENPDLLYRYYVCQSEHSEAGAFASDWAKDKSTKLSINDRIAWLERAKTSLLLQRASDRNLLGQHGEDAERKAKDVDDIFKVALLQQRILNKIDAKAIREDLYQKLCFSLLTATELYNDYAADLGMYEECLLIIYTCHENNAPHIRILWKYVICEEILPCLTRNERIFRFLQNFVSDIGMTENAVRFLSSDDQMATVPLFEEGHWVKGLERRVISVGKELYDKDVDFDFPIHNILSLLEELRGAAPQLHSFGWSLKTISEVGVPFMSILDAYESLDRSGDRIHLGGDEVDRRVEKISAIIELLEYWISSARAWPSGGQLDNASKELRGAMASGRLMQKVENLRSRTEILPGQLNLSERVRSIEGKLLLFLQTVNLRNGL